MAVGGMCGLDGTGDGMTPWVWRLLHGSTWCPGAEFKSIMAVAASMSDSGRGENMHDGQSRGVTAQPRGVLGSPSEVSIPLIGPVGLIYSPRLNNFGEKAAKSNSLCDVAKGV